MGIIFLEVHLPGFPPQLGGFVIVDQNRQLAWVRFRSSWDPAIDPLDAEVLSDYSRVIESFFDSMTYPEAVSAILELSNVVRATSELHIPVTSSSEALADKLAALLLHGPFSGIHS